MERCDVAIIGAGVLGCALARELSRYQLDVVVLERAHDVGEGSSKANSGIIHAGFHARGGSLKGVSCVRGNRLHRELAQQLDIPFIPCGGLMVAFDDEGREKIREKAERGLKSGAIDLTIISGDEARALEPRLSERVVEAMWAPSTGIISPFDLVLALAENAAVNGVAFWFNAEVEAVEPAPKGDEGWRLQTADGRTVIARYVANMAGDAANNLDAQVHPADYEVRPRLGEYVVFDKQDPARAITHVLYQAAQTDEGGTLLAPTVDGNLLAGPTSRNVANFSATGSTTEGVAHVQRVARKLIPDLELGQVIRNFAGVRTNIVNVPKELKDFVVRASAPGFVSALGIKNPGMTSAPALALRAVELLAQEGLPLHPRPNFQPRRTRPVPFLQESPKRQAQLLARDDSYAKVVCRCEGVTLGDVRALQSHPLPPTTMAGVKRRLRCGMGRCQGAFCEPRVAEALAKDLSQSICQVLYGQQGGRYVLREVKR